MRLAAARGYEELIIPFEKESVRAYKQLGETRLAGICRKRAEVEYPKKVKENRSRYEQDLKRAGGDKVRRGIEEEVTKLLAEAAPLPIAVPSRLRSVKKKEKAGEWLTAADYRELSARIYERITVPFFEKESKRALDASRRKQYEADVLKYLKLARDNFALATKNYRRAADSLKGKTDAKSRRLHRLCVKKTAEMAKKEKAVAKATAARVK